MVLPVICKLNRRRSISLSCLYSATDVIARDHEYSMRFEQLEYFRTQAEYHGTLKPADNFNAAEDAETLKKAMKGFGKEVKLIV